MERTEPTTPVGAKVGPEFRDFEVRSNTFLLKAELVEVWSKKVSWDPKKPVGSKSWAQVSRLEVTTNSFLLKAELVEVWSKECGLRAGKAG